MPATEAAIPVAIDAERFVLGSILLDESFLPDVRAVLDESDFSLEKHRTIFRRMLHVQDAGDAVDVVTVASALEDHRERESVGGISYLVELQDGLPTLPNIDSYVRIVQEKAVRRRGIVAAQHLMNRLMDQSDDSAGALSDAERLLADYSSPADKHGQWRTIGEIIANHPGGLPALVSPPKGGDGIPTPWAPITELLSGLHEGELIVVAGRPGMGKSLVAMQMCHHAARCGHGTAVFSLEMSKESLTNRLIAGVARVDSHRMRTGYLNAEDRRRVTEAAGDLADLPLWIDDTRARTESAMLAALRRLIAQGKRPKVIMIDHVQLMTGSGRKNQDRRLEIEAISNGMKHLATDYGVAVVLLSQLNRDCERENRRPQLSDLRECGALEQDADVVMFVHRPEAYAKNHGREDLRGVAEFLIAKQRSGPTGKQAMVFLGNLQLFAVAASNESPEELPYDD